MVALLVRLKLTLLRNSLRRSVWRTVGLVFGMVYALGIVVLVLAGLVGLRFASVGLTADVTVLAFSLLTLGWLVMSLLVFGVDETVDPAKFALLPVRARDLQPGLFVAGLIGSPGVATVLVALGLVVCWARTAPLTVAAIVSLPLGVATCFLLSRAGTTAFASFLASRRFRDLAFVVLALFGAGMGVAGNLFGSLARAGVDRMRTALGDLATVAGWTPFGWAWSIPADVARGQWFAAAAHLLLAATLVVGLWLAWGHFLGARLVEPVEGGGSAAKVRDGGLAERLYPASRAGGVAGRTLRYWRRDPRYMAGVAGFLIAPVVIVITQLINPDGRSEVAMLAPALLGLLVGMVVAQDLSYDGSAVWLHISAGISGREDRQGRVLSLLTIYGPILVVITVVTAALTGRWDMLAMVLGLCVGLVLIGVGVGCLVGVLWQWPAPPPGASPFQRGNSGGLPALLSFLVTTSATVVLAIPVIVAAVVSFWRPWVGYLTLPVGLVWGGAALLVGLRQGGRLLDRRWPEVLQAVSDKAS